MENSKVKVAVRCRPLNEREKSIGIRSGSAISCDILLNKVIARKKNYVFDKVYGPSSSQQQVFHSTVQPVVDEALTGYNCTLFAYGQTGTGKTHTMQGDINFQINNENDLNDNINESAGIIPRAVTYIFKYLKQNIQEYNVRISYLQIYNEELKDLLDPTNNKKIRLTEDNKKGGIYACNLEEISVQNAREAFVLLRKGVSERITAATDLNEFSSRSHTIFTVRIRAKQIDSNGEEIMNCGQLNLVDLAGSECVGKSGVRNARAREAGNINQSLLTLGRVITALVEKQSYIPYRDSKLTRLLQESLGGKAKTTIIATISPSFDNLDDSCNTLEYMNRAKNIKNTPEINNFVSKRVLIKDYDAQIIDLKQQLQTQREKDGAVYLTSDNYNILLQEKRNLELKNDELLNTIQENQDIVQSQQIKLKENDDLIIQLQKNLDKTSNELQNTKSLLSDIEKKNILLENDICKKNMLINQLKESEKQFLENGIIATKLYNNKKRNINILIDKVHTYKEIHSNNYNLVKEKTSEISKINSLFKDIINNFNEKQTKIYKTSNEKIVSLINNHIQDTNKVKDTIISISKIANDKIIEFIEKYKENNANISNNNDKYTDNEKQFSNHCNQFIRNIDLCLSNTINKIKNHFDALMDKTNCFFINFNDIISSLEDNNSLFIQSQEEIRQNIENLINDFFLNQDIHLQEQSKENIALINDNQLNFKKKISIFTSQIFEMLDKINTEQQVNMNKQKDIIEKNYIQNKNDMDTVKNKFNIHSNDLNEKTLSWYNKIKEDKNKLNNNSIQYIEEIKTKFIPDTNVIIKDELNNPLNENMDLFNKEIDSFTNTNEIRKKDLQDILSISIETLKNDMNLYNKNIQEKSNDIIQLLDNNNNSTNISCIDIQSSVKDNWNNLSNFQDNVNQSIINDMNEQIHHLEEKQNIIKSEGNTPEKDMNIKDSFPSFLPLNNNIENDKIVYNEWKDNHSNLISTNIENKENNDTINNNLKKKESGVYGSPKLNNEDTKIIKSTNNNKLTPNRRTPTSSKKNKINNCTDHHDEINNVNNNVKSNNANANDIANDNSNDSSNDNKENENKDNDIDIDNDINIKKRLRDDADITIHNANAPNVQRTKIIVPGKLRKPKKIKK